MLLDIDRRSLLIRNDWGPGRLIILQMCNFFFVCPNQQDRPPVWDLNLKPPNVDKMLTLPSHLTVSHNFSIFKQMLKIIMPSPVFSSNLLWIYTCPIFPQVVSEQNSGAVLSKCSLSAYIILIQFSFSTMLRLCQWRPGFLTIMAFSQCLEVSLSELG